MNNLKVGETVTARWTSPDASGKSKGVTPAGAENGVSHLSAMGVVEEIDGNDITLRVGKATVHVKAGWIL